MLSTICGTGAFHLWHWIEGIKNGGGLHSSLSSMKSLRINIGSFTGTEQDVYISPKSLNVEPQQVHYTNYTICLLDSSPPKIQSM